ncbi:MAG TPA: ribonuclease HII [Candidatus Goldiibacteriota bacterium]|nr:ribonuclease HII [Candidatus Goldiibacteriota bacterium]
MEKHQKLLDFDASYGSLLAGVDEAGRGPWAGPVVAAAVIIDPQKYGLLSGINDSKKIPEKKREPLFDLIASSSLAFAITEVSHLVIDRDNILNATLLAMANAVEKLSVKPALVLVDGTRCPELEGYKSEAVVDGDAKSLSIAAASILAKVHRDRIMRNYDRIFPQYGFAKHKGYGTAEHIAALKKYGICEIHRKSYKPVREIMESVK